MNDEQWALEPHAFRYDPPTDTMRAEAQAEIDYWKEVIRTGGGPFPPSAFPNYIRLRCAYSD